MLGVYDYTVILTYISLWISIGGMMLSLNGHLDLALPILVVLRPFLHCDFRIALHAMVLLVGLLFVMDFKLKKPGNKTLSALVGVVAVAVVWTLRRRFM